MLIAAAVVSVALDIWNIPKLFARPAEQGLLLGLETPAKLDEPYAFAIT
jgi:hypothetical protein